MLTAIPQPPPNHAAQTPPPALPETVPSSHECPESTHTHSKSSPADNAPAPAPDSNTCAPSRAAQKPPPRQKLRQSLSPPAHRACPQARTKLRHRDGVDEAAQSMAEAQAARQHPSTRQQRNHSQPSPKRCQPTLERSRKSSWRSLQGGFVLRTK